MALSKKTNLAHPRFKGSDMFSVAIKHLENTENEQTLLFGNAERSNMKEIIRIYFFNTCIKN